MFIFQGGERWLGWDDVGSPRGIGTAWLWSKSRYRIKPVYPGAPSEEPSYQPTLDAYEPY